MDANRHGEGGYLPRGVTFQLMICVESTGSVRTVDFAAQSDRRMCGGVRVNISIEKDRVYSRRAGMSEVQVQVGAGEAGVKPEASADVYLGTAIALHFRMCPDTSLCRTIVYCI